MFIFWKKYFLLSWAQFLPSRSFFHYLHSFLHMSKWFKQWIYLWLLDSLFTFHMWHKIVFGNAKPMDKIWQTAVSWQLLLVTFISLSLISKIKHFCYFFNKYALGTGGYFHPSSLQKTNTKAELRKMSGTLSVHVSKICTLHLCQPHTPKSIYILSRINISFSTIIKSHCFTAQNWCIFK